MNERDFGTEAKRMQAKGFGLAGGGQIGFL
jgi:hypothetical protein